MAYNFLRAERDQPFLLPPDLRDWLPQDHLAWFILDVVDQLDLEPFYRAHRDDGHGHPAYDPKILLGVLLYGYCLGLLGRRLLNVCVKFSEDEVESGVRSTSADTSSDQPLSEWPAGRDIDRTSAQRTAAVGLTDRGSLVEFALMADRHCGLPMTVVRELGGPRLASLDVRDGLGAEQVVPGLAAAGHGGDPARDDDLGWPRMGVVVGGHGHAVGAGVEDGDQVARREVGEVGGRGQHVGRLADRPHDLGRIGGTGGAHRHHPVHGLVESRAHELVHTRVHHEHPAGAAVLAVEHPGDQRTGPPDQVAARLDAEPDAAAGDQRGQGPGEDLRPERRPAAVVDRQAAADVEPVERQPGGTAGLDHLDADLGARRHPVRVGKLRADVHVDAGGIQIWEVALGGARQQLVRDLDGHAELGLVMTGPDVGVGVDLDVGVDAHGEACAPAEPGGDDLERLQFVGGFDVDHHAVPDGQGQLLGGLADAGEDRPSGVATGAQHAQQLATADHVEAGAGPSQPG